MADYQKGLTWSGQDADGKPTPIPAIGSQVYVKINRIGISEVVGYFVEDGYIGLMCVPRSAPEWYVKQNGAKCPCHVFGAELRDGGVES